MFNVICHLKYAICSVSMAQWLATFASIKNLTFKCEVTFLVKLNCKRLCKNNFLRGYLWDYLTSSGKELCTLVPRSVSYRDSVSLVRELYATEFYLQFREMFDDGTGRMLRKWYCSRDVKKKFQSRQAWQRLC